MGGVFRHLASRGALVLGVAALAGIGYFYAGNLRAGRAVDQRITQLRSRVATLQAHEVQLNELLKYFDSEAYAEQKARLEFGLAKPGESMVVVAPSGSVPPARPAPSGSTLVRWWRYFFGKSDR